MMERCMECIGIDDVENIPPSRMPANMGSADDIGRPSWLPLDVPPSTPAPCRCSPCSCIRLLCSPMFGVVFFIVGISYAPYVLWVPWKYFALKCFCLSVFHVLIALLIGSYVMCVFTDPGTVPLSWQRIVEADPDLANDHVICRKSGLYRPLRSHFCSVTRRVVLNMCAPLLSSRAAAACARFQPSYSLCVYPTARSYSRAFLLTTAHAPAHCRACIAHL